MSEYQYYEFRTDGRTLDEAARKRLHQLSSRAIVTSTQAIYTYSYGDFRYDCEELIADFFDVMLYMNSFGTRQLMFRLPLELVDISKIEPFCIPDTISYSIYEHFLILNLNINDEEGGGWIEGEEWLDDLICIRQELLNGDFRALYIAWLAAAQCYQAEDEDIEPAVPPNLQKLSSSQTVLMSYFQLNQDLLTVAAECSPVIDYLDSNWEQLMQKISEDEKTHFLLSFLKNEPDLKIKLQRRLQCFMEIQEKDDSSPRRSVSQLRDLAESAE